MKIFQFIYSLASGGAERFVVDLSNELSNKSDVSLYTLRNDTILGQGFYKPELNKNIKYYCLNIEPGFKISLIWKFYQLLKSEKPDVVHCHLSLVFYFFPLSIIFYKRIAFVYTVHTHAINEEPNRLKKLIRRLFYRHKLVWPIAISEETRKSYEKHYNLNTINTIVNGRAKIIETIEYAEVVNHISRFKKDKDTLVICHVARYAEVKNQEMLVTVFNKLIEEGANIILLMIGQGYENAERLKLKARSGIYFLGPKTNIGDYFLASDAFCLSSKYEGMPISLIEAFSCGCTPVCTPVGGIVNTIQHGVTGYLSKSINEEDYYNVFLEFIQNYHQIDKEKLIEYYNENFSIEKCAFEYLRLYEKISSKNFRYA
jgi:glycosyltransferase involved in cell wall biosynthesis